MATDTPSIVVSVWDDLGSSEVGRAAPTGPGGVGDA